MRIFWPYIVGKHKSYEKKNWNEMKYNQNQNEYCVLLYGYSYHLMWGFVHSYLLLHTRAHAIRFYSYFYLLIYHRLTQNIVSVIVFLCIMAIALIRVNVSVCERGKSFNCVCYEINCAYIHVLSVSYSCILILWPKTFRWQRILNNMLWIAWNIHLFDWTNAICVYI